MVLTQLFYTMRDYTNEKKFAFFAENQDQLENFCSSISRGSRFDKTLVQAITKMDEMAYKNFAFNVPEMFELSPCDRMSLITSNFDVPFTFAWSSCMSSLDFPEYFKTLLKFGHENASKKSHISRVWHRLCNVSAPQNIENHWKISILYDDCNDRDSENQEQIFGQILSWMRFDPKASADILLHILLTMILLFSDGEGSIELEQPRMVKTIQRRYLDSLFR